VAPRPSRGVSYQRVPRATSTPAPTGSMIEERRGACQASARAVTPLRFTTISIPKRGTHPTSTALPANLSLHETSTSIPKRGVAPAPTGCRRRRGPCYPASAVTRRPALLHRGFTSPVALGKRHFTLTSSTPAHLSVSSSVEHLFDSEDNRILTAGPSPPCSWEGVGACRSGRIQAGSAGSGEPLRPSLRSVSG
jgi:hypothetical protein